MIKDVNMLGEGMFLPYKAVAKLKIIMLTLNSRAFNKFISAKESKTPYRNLKQKVLSI